MYYYTSLLFKSDMDITYHYTYCVWYILYTEQWTQRAKSNAPFLEH